MSTIDQADAETDAQRLTRQRAEAHESPAYAQGYLLGVLANIEEAVRHGRPAGGSDLHSWIILEIARAKAVCSLILKSRSGAVLWTSDHATARESVVSAVDAGANLTGADLTRANLTGADLTRANLARADLTRANLTGANLAGANLTGADLTGANLAGANLARADLARVRDDLWSVLDAAPNEVIGLRLALAEGRVNGSTYTGSCACLVGTIANERRCSVNDLGTLMPDSNRPAERWFLAIQTGMSEAHPVVAITLAWIDEWMATRTGVPA